MNDKTLRLFLSVADSGSFSKAEETTYVSRQAILKQMNALEEEVGAALFLRSNRGIRLTEAGKKFYEGVRKIITQQDQLLAECRKAARNERLLRVGNVEHQALLGEIVDAFSERYPEIRIQRVIHPNHSGEYRVIHDIMDVAETFDHPVLPKMLAEHPLGYTPLVSLPWCAVVTPEHPLARCTRVSLAELRAYQTVYFRPMTPPALQDALTKAYAGYEEHLESRMDVDNQVPAAFACTEAGGVYLSASYFLRQLPQFRLIPLQEGWRQEYGVLYRLPMSETVQKFVELARELYRDRAF